MIADSMPDPDIAALEQYGILLEADDLSRAIEVREDLEARGLLTPYAEYDQEWFTDEDLGAAIEREWFPVSWMPPDLRREFAETAKDGTKLCIRHPGARADYVR